MSSGETMMMSSISRSVGMIGAALALGLVLTGCPEKGPAEKAGEEIDEAAEKVGDAFE